MLPTLDIGPLALPTAGVILIVFAWLVLSVSERAAKRVGLDQEAIYTLVAIMMAAALIGARFLFVILHWPAYREDLLSIVWPLTTGFNWWAGSLIAVLAGFFTMRAKALPPLATLDALAPGLMLTLIAVSLVDFAAGPGFGQATVLPWAIDVFGVRRHPVQLYEVLVGIIALAAWWRAARQRRPDGRLFLLTLTIYAGGRLVFDAFRANTPLTAGGFHIVQIVSLAVALASIFLLGRQVEPAANEADSP